MSDKRLGSLRQSVLPSGELCRTAPDGANEGKAARPLSRAVSALRPWPARRKTICQTEAQKTANTLANAR